MAPLISEDLPIAPESLDLYREELEVTKLCAFSKDTENVEKSTVGGIGHDLAKIIRDATAAGQTTHGVFECAQLLTEDPDGVILCVLPAADDQHDVTVHIQHTLIQAFCWENDIQIIKVDCVNKLADLLNVVPTRDALCTQLSCLLIQQPSEDLSPEMERVTQYIDNVMFSDVYPRPVVTLPE